MVPCFPQKSNKITIMEKSPSGITYLLSLYVNIVMKPAELLSKETDPVNLYQISPDKSKLESTKTSAQRSQSPACAHSLYSCQ